MLKKFLTALVLFLSSFSLSQAEPILEVPTQFFVKQHWFSLTNTFDIQSKDQKFGTIHRKFFSLMPQYLFYDVNEQLQATAKMRFFSVGPTFDIFDANEQPIGQVNERLFAFFHTFDLYRADGYHVAKAKFNLLGTKYTVKDPVTDEVIAYLWRKFFRLKDNWTIDIVNQQHFIEKQIDPCMFMLVMAFQTDLDYWSKHNYSHSYYNNIPFLNEPVSTSTNLHSYRVILNSYRAELGNIEPTEADFIALDKFVEKNWDESQLEMDQESPDKGIVMLLPLLNSDDLTLGQRSVLFHLLDEELN